VLAAATKVFYEHGYTDATMHHVARELDLATGSLYHYARTKDDLLAWVLDDAHAEVEAILVAVAEREDLAPLERLALYVRGQVALDVSHLPLLSVYYRDLRLLRDPRLRSIRERRVAHHTWVVELIRLAQERGEAVADTAPEVLAHCVFGAFVWVHRWYRPETGMDAAAVVDAVTGYALAGVARP
jgi:AcrR family transcriptional regulator